MATEPLSDHESDPAALRAERDEAEARAAAAEAVAERLADELLEARRRLAAAGADPGEVNLFEAAAPAPDESTSLASDGSDPRLLSLGLVAVAVVAALVSLLAVANSGLSLFTVVMVLITIALAWGAWKARVPSVVVSIEDGVVRIGSGQHTYHLDLRQESTVVEMRGAPGDADWRVRFVRRVLDPLVVDATMVDPHAFVAELRRWRPDL